jgi:hypothetical protein
MAATVVQQQPMTWQWRRQRLLLLLLLLLHPLQCSLLPCREVAQSQAQAAWLASRSAAAVPLPLIKSMAG